jgi:hypothetical protein
MLRACLHFLLAFACNSLPQTGQIEREREREREKKRGREREREKER